MLKKLWVDFNNMQDYGVVMLNCAGTIADITTKNIALEDGLNITVWMEDLDEYGNEDPLEVDAEVRYIEEYGSWTAVFDEKNWRHRFDKI